MKQQICLPVRCDLPRGQVKNASRSQFSVGKQEPPHVGPREGAVYAVRQRQKKKKIKIKTRKRNAQRGCCF